MAKFELYKDPHGEFRWRLKSTDGRSIATSGEGYKTKVAVQEGIAAVKRDALAAGIEDQTGQGFNAAIPVGRHVRRARAGHLMRNAPCPR